MFRQWILTAAILALPTCALAQGATGTGGVQSGLRSGEPLSGVRGGANTTGAGGTGVAGPGGTGVDQPGPGRIWTRHWCGWRWGCKAVDSKAVDSKAPVDADVPREMAFPQNCFHS